MTFNLAARQKPKDISPNRITACSSPSSHNFQLDSLTAARSAAFTARRLQQKRVDSASRNSV